MTSKEIRASFLKFFEEREHTVVPSSSLLSDDPSVLLTTAGMQQFKPYYSGEADPFSSSHPTLQGKPLGSKNTASIQKSFRTSDIEEVGDKTHLTFFEMLGNFSFGGYFKEKAIQYAYEYFQSINLPLDYVTIFEGDDEAPQDKESAEIWRSLGVKDIRLYGREDNFWGPTGAQGPCGPSTELYVNDVEVWNLVFNQYYKQEDGTYRELDTPGVDTGMGFERLTIALQGVSHIFETDLFTSLMKQMPADMDPSRQRILADHTRASAFLISDGVKPANKEAGYILRRLIRRATVLYYLHLNTNDKNAINELFATLLTTVCNEYKEFYANLDQTHITKAFSEEVDRFMATLSVGIKEMNKLNAVDGATAFRLYESFGLPYEVQREIAPEKTKNLSEKDFEDAFEKHRQKSRHGAEKKFGGHGLLLDTGELKATTQEEVEKVTRLHTATHLLQAGLRAVLGNTVKQMGSDITPQRLRFDFSFDRRLEQDEIQQVQDWVNKAIKDALPVACNEVERERAIQSGALYNEKETYPDVVKVYSVGEQGSEISKEMCGGPHIENTSQIQRFQITKQESVGAGIRRIRGVVE